MSAQSTRSLLTHDILTRAPKVLLHEHLDGCLRPETVLDLAREIGYLELPESDPVRLGQWFFEGADRGSLAQYLEGFRHTIAVMQTAEALERVAYELGEDLAAENCVYFEVRFAPVFHTAENLGLDAVMRAVLRGLERAREDFGIESGVIVCAMRNQSADLSLKLAELAVSWFDRGCCGFDLAGEEAGHPAKHHINAFQFIKRSNGSITIHAGESFGPESIWQALQFCGAHRIGHGTHLIDDIAIYEGKVVKVGSLATYVLDHRIPIECCLQSNVHTGAVKSLAEHPFPYLLREGYRVTLNTDNRLMSHTTMTDEFRVAVETYGCDLQDLERVTINAMNAAFYPYADRHRIIDERIEPGYEALQAELAAATGGVSS
ncbi:Aminodeoxyfutalosine deaminase [Planctomycetes bacterium Poly30]|uniref:adenosine deaminase n=1 Tax=Saltatorellus ferox TaxID=2528018 RepID=A0A518EUH5_9BACT|nr:Aminodeoxyfutalosine deaminase [Planctomycetes bacterium Poly30]